MKTSDKKLPPLQYIFKPDFKTYHNPQHVLSYKGICNLFLIEGGRGIGKTTGWADYVSKRFLKYREEFVYIRRNPNGAKAGRDLLSNILAPVSTYGIGIEGCYNYMYGNERIGWTLALTKQNDLKSGFDFSKVTTIIYDECVIKETATRRYIKDEPIELLQLINTIVRTRKNYIIVLLSNNDDKFNIWTEYWNIPLFDNIYVDKKRGIYVEYAPHNPNLIEKEKETPLYKLIQGTKYGDYAYENKVLTNVSYNNIKEKDINSKIICRFIYRDKTLNVYLEPNENIFIEFRDKIIKDNITFTIIENGQVNYFDIRYYRSSEIKKFIEKLYYEGRWYGDCELALELFTSIIEEV